MTKQMKDMTEPELSAHVSRHMDFATQNKTSDTAGIMIIFVGEDGICQYGSTIDPECTPDALREIAQRIENRELLTRTPTHRIPSSENRAQIFQRIASAAANNGNGIDPIGEMWSIVQHQLKLSNLPVIQMSLAIVLLEWRKNHDTWPWDMPVTQITVDWLSKKGIDISGDLKRLIDIDKSYA